MLEHLWNEGRYFNWSSLLLLLFPTLMSPTNNLWHRTFFCQYSEGPFFVTTLKGTGKLIGILYRNFYYHRMYPKGWPFKSSGINAGVAPWVRTPTSVFCHLRLHLLGQPSEWRLSGVTDTGLNMRTSWLGSFGYEEKMFQFVCYCRLCT
jgi:hypothetical protein